MTRPVQATVLAVDGPGMISANARGQSLPLVPGAHPGKGDILELTDSSRAALALLPNLLVQLDRNARLEIVRLAITKDGNDTAGPMRGRYADVRLRTGRMLASQAWGDAIAKFSLRTAQGELVTTSNALFWVEADEHRTRVTCVSGSVGFQVSKAGEITGIPPGFVGEWSESSSNLIAAETEARGQEELEEGLEIEEKLRFLSNQNHLALPR
jgi:hypothetical protein